VSTLLTELRLAAGIPTRRELARLLGIHATVVDRWEKGEQTVPVEQAQRIAMLIGQELPREMVTAQHPRQKVIPEATEIKRVVYTAVVKCAHCGRQIGEAISTVRPVESPPPVLRILPGTSCDECGGPPILDGIERQVVVEYLNIVDEKPRRGRPPKAVQAARQALLAGS
jgi:DNA-binding transcriptional regulator YdaS (Cro superfamily)